jgi:hypothetical protein
VKIFFLFFFALRRMAQQPSAPEYTVYALTPIKMTIRSLVSNLEKFTGRNEITVENWCNLVDDAFSIEEWDDKQKLVIASQQLAGTAAAWYEAERKGSSPPTKWSELKASLIKRFGGIRSASVSRLELSRLRWKESQDLEEHISRFTAIRSRISDAKDPELVTYFRQTLPPYYLNDSLYREPTTLEQAFSFARSLHASRHHGFHDPSPATQSVSDKDGVAPMDLDIQQLVKTLNSLGVRTGNQQPGGGADNRKCYRCGNRGHIARNCRQKQASGSNGQRHFQPRQFGPTVNSRAYRLAELTYAFEQQQQQQPPPGFDLEGASQPGKEQGQ